MTMSTAEGMTDCPHSSDAFGAPASLLTSPSTSLIRASLVNQLRLVLAARPITEPEVLVIFADGHVGRFAHACGGCVSAEDLIIPIAGSPVGIRDATTGSGSAAEPGPSS